MTGRKILLLVLLAALALPPFAGINTYWLHVLNVTWIFAIAALGLNLATGVTGQIVLGQAALMGVGAYAAGLLMVRLHWPWFAAGAAALAVAVAVGVALGLLSMRIKGHYLAITTLALNEIFRQVVLNQAGVTGGPMGLRDIPTFALPFWSGDTDRQAYLPLLAAMVAAFALALASLGIYAVLSFTVNQRVQDIGIRMALGASASHVQRGIVLRTLGLAAVGLGFGMAASRALSSTLGSLLFGVTSGDTATFVAMGTLLTAVAVIAGYIPARRASRIDPAVALRSR